MNNTLKYECFVQYLDAKRATDIVVYSHIIQNIVVYSTYRDVYRYTKGWKDVVIYIYRGVRQTYWCLILSHQVGYLDMCMYVAVIKSITGLLCLGHDGNKCLYESVQYIVTFLKDFFSF